MSDILKNCRHVPGWTRTFLTGIKNGQSPTVAAKYAGVSAQQVQKLEDNDPTFKKQYDAAWDGKNF